MKRFFLTTGILALAAPMVIAQTTTWTPDPNHSEVDFTVKHLSITNVRGHFGKVSGTLQMDQSDISKSSVNVTVDVTAVDTGVAARDNDIKGANYFDTATYPTATFTSTSVAKNSDGGLTVNGNLTLHGVTKPVTLQVEPPTGPIDGQRNSKHMGFSASAHIDRTEFGIGAKVPNAMLSTDVKLEIEIDAVLQQPQKQ
jgi:polyisoprenoid-binding protein YceI